jgi:hypothetical protein
MIALAAARIEAARLLREAAAQASGISDCSQQLQKYCKAYYLKELRQFPVWCESRINWQDQAQADMPPAQDGDPLSENEVVFIHHDLTVTQSMWHNEHVIFNQITPAWEAFCAQVLHFKVPDDFDLVGEPL